MLGFKLEKVLEISDEMLKQNAAHFIKNYPDIPVIGPSTWENDEYLLDLQKEDIDLMCCNCPCSSLSQINRNASVNGKNNIHFYRLFNVFEKVHPKVFVIENAPTLIKLGFPILRDMVNRLKNDYMFTIIRDEAGNHEVPMRRMRTLVVGWRKDHFTDGHPIVNADKHEPKTIGDTLADIMDNTTNDCKSKKFDCLSKLYKYAKATHPLITSLVLAYNEGDEQVKAEILNGVTGTSCETPFKTALAKIASGGNPFDKSPHRGGLKDRFQSFASVQEYMHPVQPRTLNLLELKRIMTYPDNFDLAAKSEVPISQALAQGVPVKFGEYIATQAKLGLDGKLEKKEADIIFQNNNTGKMKTYSYDEFIGLESL